MSTITTILAGFAVAVGGVVLGRKIEKIKTKLDRDDDLLKKRSGNQQNPVIEAERDPETGTFHHKK